MSASDHPGFTDEESELVARMVAAYMIEQCGWQNAYEYHGHTECWKNGTRAALDVLAEHDRAVAAAAWDEGRQSVGIDMAKPLGDDGMKPATANPYALIMCDGDVNGDD